MDQLGDEMRRILYVTSGAVGAIAFFAMLMAPGVLSNIPAATADEAGVVHDHVLDHSVAAVKIHGAEIAEKHAANADIEFVVEKDPSNDLAIIINAVNKGASRADLDADVWTIQFKNTLTGSATQPKEITGEMRQQSISSDQTIEVARIDLSNHADDFLEFPGTYQVIIWGEDYVEPDVAEIQENEELDVKIELTGEKVETIPLEVEANSRNVIETQYKIVANVDIGYDIKAIMANPDRILKAEKMSLAFEGDNKEFAVTPSRSSEMRLYLTNEGEEPISEMIRISSLTIFKADDASEGVRIESVADYAPDSCPTISPNENIALGKLVLDTNDGLLRDLMNRLAGEDPKTGSAMVEGLYIVKAYVGTAACTTNDGEKAAGGDHELIAAFEVKQ